MRTTSARWTYNRARSPCWSQGKRRQTSAPADSGQTYEPFQYRTLLQVSATLGVPYAYLSNDMLKANYSNSRQALLEFRRRIEAYQHAVMVWQLCRRVWERWMDTAVLAGALDMLDCERRRSRLARKWDLVDPFKMLAPRSSSHTQGLTECGYDAKQVDADSTADKRRENELGAELQGRIEFWLMADVSAATSQEAAFMGRHRPMNRGFRFSMNERKPSLVSSVSWMSVSTFQV
jgi:capsid protein